MPARWRAGVRTELPERPIARSALERVQGLAAAPEPEEAPERELAQERAPEQARSEPACDPSDRTRRHGARRAPPGGAAAASGARERGQELAQRPFQKHHENKGLNHDVASWFRDLFFHCF